MNAPPSTLSFYLTPRLGGSVQAGTAAEVRLGGCRGPLVECCARLLQGTLHASADREVGLPDVPQRRWIYLDRDGVGPLAIALPAAVDDALRCPRRSERRPHAVESARRGCVVRDPLVGGWQHHAAARYGDVARQDVDPAVGVDGAERHVARAAGLD